ncbi:hypothetical protein [Megasphaera sp.]|uniref:hypothetical protein n=1 Tax=Megasphaera sp. TaxID=2023260 RepID=UPI0025C58210|nr:hypothetical protein [Megasphaera sp.]MBS5214123.1 hypothetical protein [Megasphaera sp.]
MKKKLFCVTCLLLLQTAFFAAPVYQPVQAAKGGIRMSAPRSAPAVTAPKAAPKANTNNNASSAQSQTRNQTAAPRTNANTTGQSLVGLGRCHARHRPLCRGHVPGQHVEQPLWYGELWLGRRFSRPVV